MTEWKGEGYSSQALYAMSSRPQGHLTNSSLLFSQDEPHGTLRCLLDGEEDAGEEKIAIPSLLVDNFPQQPLQGVVKMLNKPICLEFIYRGLHMLHLLTADTHPSLVGP